jgi:hypothetical protein
MSNNVKPSESLLNLIENKYKGTTKTTGHIIWFVQAARENPSATIVELVLDRLSGEDVGTTSTFDATVHRLRALARKPQISPAESEALLEALALAAPFRESKEGPKSKDSVLENKSDVVTYCDSLETTTQKVIAYLVLAAGVKPNDLLRDKYRLQGLKSGRIEVGQRLDAKHTAPRSVTFDPSFINSVDPLGEHVEILANTYFSADNAGLVALDDISPILRGTPMDFNQLRASYCIHRVKDGATLGQVAEEIGVKNVTGLRTRLQRYLDANGIDLTL